MRQDARKDDNHIRYHHSDEATVPTRDNLSNNLLNKTNESADFMLISQFTNKAPSQSSRHTRVTPSTRLRKTSQADPLEQSTVVTHPPPSKLETLKRSNDAEDPNSELTYFVNIQRDKKKRGEKPE